MAMAAVVVPVVSLVGLSRPLIGAAIAAVVISTAVVRGVGWRKAGVERDEESWLARVTAAERGLLKLGGRSNTDR